jgi:hypothetical protein
MKTIALALLLVPSIAAAREYSVAGGAAVHVVRASSFDALSTSDAMTFGELAFGVEEDLELFGVIDHVGLDLRWSTGSTSAESFSLLRADLGVHDFQLGLSARHDLYSWLGVYVRGALGVARAELRLEDRVGGETWASDSDWAHTTQLGVGSELAATPVGLSGLSVGLRFEAGVSTTGDFAFSARRSPAGEGVPLDTRAAGLGDLDLDGLTYRFVAFGRF